MKRLWMIAPLLLLLGGASLAAQGAPMTGKGTWGFFVETTNLAVDDVGAEYFIRDRLAVGSGLFVDLVSPSSAGSPIHFSLSPFVQYHFLQKGPFSLSAGGFLSWDSRTWGKKDDAGGRTTITDVRLGGLAGLDWYFLNNVSLGARYRAFLRLERNANNVDGTVTSNSTTHASLVPSADFVLAFHLK